MGHVRVEQALQALEDAGLRAGRGYPGGKMSALTGPVAALWLHKVTGDGATVAVEVFAPAVTGGAACEDEALKAMAALKAAGAVCELSACAYDKSARCYCVRILAGWYVTGSPGGDSSSSGHLSCAVAVNGEPLPYLTGFTAKRVQKLEPLMDLCAGVGQVRTEAGYWELQMEELLPQGAAMPQQELYDFTVTVSRADGTETYTGCRISSMQRQEMPNGVKQVRIARTWAERSQTYA